MNGARLLDLDPQGNYKVLMLANLDYRDRLQLDFENRKRKNHRYTLRAYSKFLSIDSGSLSAILRKKRHLPRSQWNSVLSKLNLQGLEKRDFIYSLFVENQLAFDEAFIEQEPQLVLDSQKYAEIISEWEFAAALCLFDIPSVEFKAKSLSDYLDLSEERAQEVFVKLFNYGFLVLKDGRVEKAFSEFTTSTDVESANLQKSHLGELDLAKKRLLALSHKEREFVSFTFAGSAEDFNKMTHQIRSYCKKFGNQFENKKSNQVFQLSIQLFPLSKKIKK